MKKLLLTMLAVLLIPVGAVAQEAYAVYNDHTLTFYYDDMRSSRTGDTYSLNTGNNYPGWYAHSGEIIRAVFDSSFEGASLSTTSRWFQMCSHLSTIDGIRHLKTSGVEDMSGMFQSCQELTELDLSHFDTESTYDVQYMFMGCRKLANLTLWDHEYGSISNMTSMFELCSSLTTLDLSNFRPCRNMDWMFENCPSLTTIYVSGLWETGNWSLYSGNYMFNGCDNLVGEAGTAYSSDHYGLDYAHADGGTSNPGYLTYITVNITQGDNSSVISGRNWQNVNVLLDGAAFSAEKWMTLCLPFSATEEQTTAALGDGVDIEELTSSEWDEATKKLTLGFTKRTAIEAGKPYLVKVAAEKVNPTFNRVTVRYTSPADNVKSTTYCDMKGVVNATELAASESTLIVSDNQFFYVSETSTLPATKCYFTLKGDAQQAQGLSMTFSDDEESTAISDGLRMKGEEAADAWHDLSGRRLNTAPTRKGVYIHNGKKVVVR